MKALNRKMKTINFIRKSLTRKSKDPMILIYFSMSTNKSCYTTKTQGPYLLKQIDAAHRYCRRTCSILTNQHMG